MARSYPANTQIQKFLEESYNKERDARLGWYRQQQAGGSTQPAASRQFQVFRKKVQEACPKAPEGLLHLRQTVKPKSYHRRIVPTDDHLVRLAKQDSDSSTAGPTKDMRNPGPRTRDLLYDGFTKEGRGRYQYLQARYQCIPEVKYRFPLLSSWEYGWRLSDVMRVDEASKPAQGRTRIVADTFYTRTGIPTLQRQSTY